MWELEKFLPEVPDEVLALTADELAYCILKFIAAELSPRSPSINSYSFGYQCQTKLSYADRKGEIANVLSEGWAWLVRECLLIPQLENSSKQDFILSRKGKELAESADFERFRQERMIPRGQFHPTIAGRAFSDFLRGDYSGAVFKAMRDVEISVRKAANLPNSLVGVRLMRTAFRAKDGPLTEAGDEESEIQAVGDLFAGAIGMYKNPSSHRDVDIDPRTAAEVMTLASHLLRIVEERTEAVGDRRE